LIKQQQSNDAILMSDAALYIDVYKRQCGAGMESYLVIPKIGTQCVGGAKVNNAHNILAEGALSHK